MRQIGTLADLHEAETFEDYLLTLDINAKIDGEAGEWAVWILNEDDLESAKQELDAFRENPRDARYTESRQSAVELRQQAETLTKQTKKNIVDVRSRWKRPLASRCPITFALIAASVLVAFGSSLGEKYEPVIKALSFASADKAGMYKLFGHPQNDIRRGQIWRLVSPIIIHFGFFHILFNMMWLRDLGSAIEFRRGSLRFAAIVIAIAVVSNIGQYVDSGPGFGGMSGVVFGLFGYIWMKGRFDPESGFFMPSNLVLFMMAWFVLCLTGIVGHVANSAHGMGLLTGVVLGYAPIAWRNLTRG